MGATMKFTIELPQEQQFNESMPTQQPIENRASQSKFTIEMPQQRSSQSRFTIEMPQQEESYPEAGMRNLARSGSRIIETLGGLPKTAVNIAESLYGMIPESLRDQGLISKALPGGDLVGSAFGKAYDIGSSLLPSSENIRQGISQIAPEGYLEPKNEYEHVSDEIVSDITSLMTPIGPLAGVKFGKALKISGAGNLASYLTKKVGGGESAQAGVKLGTTLLTSLGMAGSLRKKADEFYKVAKESIRPGEKIAAEPIQKMLNQVTKDYTSSGLRKAAGKVEVENVVDEIRGFMHNDKIGLNDLWQVKKDMREAINLVDPRSKAGAELSKLSKGLDAALKGSSNKEFSTAVKSADELYSGVKRGEKINNFVKNALSNKITKTGGVVSLLTNPITTLTNIVTAAPYAVPAGAAALGGAHGINALYGAFKSPAIRKAYASMMNAAIRENAQLVVSYAKKLNQLLKDINQKSR